ncbi:hypothetical protein EQ718_08230 [Paracoccus versutus]|uniref:Uncharacterized protein n=1 Tax=Paracoccus versutus TaxID=34007 RepID=A0AAQ0KN78_PARVE|nr:hypothetical protein [Paracoccus versutus]REG53171.1 hypothetical protein ATH84_100768 [Paracoccus versutus]WEJ78868.1 hypothetical protein EQ718_08230 [Paracoccus versutus]
MRVLLAGLTMVCLAATASAETALDSLAPGPRAAWNNLVLGLTQTDGSIDVVIAERPDPVALANLLDLLVLHTGLQVRFSVFHDVADRGEVLAQIYAFREVTGTDLHVCRSWWSWPEADGYAAMLRDRFGGSLVFIDNGDSSDAYDNPASDFMAARILDPLFAGVFGPDPRRIEDGGDYLAAMEMFWRQIDTLNIWDRDRLLVRGGWVDGCGDR